MKKFLALVVAVLMVFSCVTGCAKKDGPSIADAKAYLETLYKDGAKETPVDYDVVAKVLVNNVEFKVTWETDNDKISVKESDKADFYTIDVPDKTEAEISKSNLEAIVLPGGMPGTVNLENSKTVQDFIDYAAQNNLLIAAICAAPSILGHKNLLANKKATCFTGFEKDLFGSDVINAPVVTDKNIITAFGAGAVFEFGFAIVSALIGEEKSQTLRKQMRYI